MIETLTQSNLESERLPKENSITQAPTTPEIEGLLAMMPAITTEFATEMGCEPPRPIERMPEPKYQVAQCHANVQRKVYSHGGRAVWGWHFTLNTADTNQPKMDAAFHAVWESRQGELIDITPQSERVVAGWKAGVFMPLPFFCEDKRYFQECEVEKLDKGLLRFRTVRQVFPQHECFSGTLV
ncbi:MAG TPA: hypothetical protein VH643_09160 [Gemmataceae bacterium]|jgi:hypothetical protein